MAEEVRNALASGGGGWRPFLASNPEWEGVADRVTNCHTNVSSTVYDASLPPPPTSKCIFNTILLLSIIKPLDFVTLKLFSFVSLVGILAPTTGVYANCKKICRLKSLFVA